MARPPLHHVGRVRKSDDLTFLRAGIMDEVLINANQLENCPETTATALRQTTLPFSIDPVLTRFQMPQWWRNANGETKRNYTRLGAAYVKGTSIELPTGPLIEVVPTDQDWRILARNVIDYQRSRLDMPAQLDLLSDDLPRELRPVRLNAPALVAFSSTEDRVNRLLAEASAEAAGTLIAVPVIIPIERLAESGELDRLLASVATDAVSSYFVWTPELTEERLLSDHNLFAALLRAIANLAERSIPVGHLHGNYTVAALHDAGIAALVCPLRLDRQRRASTRHPRRTALLPDLRPCPAPQRALRPRIPAGARSRRRRLCPALLQLRVLHGIVRRRPAPARPAHRAPDRHV